MIIKVERTGVSVRAEQIEQEGKVMYWAVEARRAGSLVSRYRVSGHMSMVDVFSGLVTTAAEVLARTS